MSSKRYKIAFLTGSDPRDKRTWSGIHFYAMQALQRHCGEVTPLGPHRPELIIFAGKVLSKLNSVFRGRRFDYVHSILLAKAYGRYFTRQLRSGRYDMVFCSAASTETAFLKTGLPVLYLADATMARMIDYYPFYTGLSERSKKQALEVERRGISNATALLYASEWAASSARSDFGAPAAKTHVIPLGANIEEVPPAEKVEEKNSGPVCRLLFLGVQWERKGGPIAFEALQRLNAMGVAAELTVCGCVPPPEFKDERMKVIPFLNKNNPGERKQFNELLFSSDLLILPTRAECFGLVFCEASAYGIPSVSCDTGGVSGAVREGVNGMLLPPSAGGKEYAERIARLWRDKTRYNELVRSSRALYDSTLNWDAWGMEVKMIMDRLSS